MRAQEVARKLGISHNLVLRLLRDGKLPGFKIGRVWLIRRDHLEQYLDRLMRAVRPDALE
ncbi:MAG TPA: helix-turn-helix domain-containing protein [Planctomycetota bacterium]|jgi:excisionase family DNA binding protein